MSVRVELHQFDYLRKEHVKKPPNLRVDVFDPRHSGMLLRSVGRAVYQLLRDGTSYDVPVYFAVQNEQVGGLQVPFIVINSDEPELATKITKLLSEYFAEEVEISVVPIMRLY